MPKQHSGSKIRKPTGRPPRGKDESGQPTPLSKYPKLTIYMPGVLKSQLHAAAMMQRRSVWEVVKEAVEAYLHRLPPDQWQTLESLAKYLKGDTP